MNELSLPRRGGFQTIIGTHDNGTTENAGRMKKSKKRRNKDNLFVRIRPYPSAYGRIRADTNDKDKEKDKDKDKDKNKDMDMESESDKDTPYGASLTVTLHCHRH